MRSLVRVQDGPLCGGIAQLVERLLCKQDVSGSSPLTSTEGRVQQLILLGTRELAGLKSSENLENCIARKILSGS